MKNRFALSVGRLLRQILKRNGTREFTLEKNLTSVHSVTRFNRSGNLKAHERIHTGEKLHTCDQCGRSFTQAYGLKHLHSILEKFATANYLKHLDVHSEEKSHLCTLCRKSFFTVECFKITPEKTH